MSTVTETRTWSASVTTVHQMSAQTSTGSWCGALVPMGTSVVAHLPLTRRAIKTPRAAMSATRRPTPCPDNTGIGSIGT